jgi:hypothetical protein
VDERKKETTMKITRRAAQTRSTSKKEKEKERRK